MLWDTGFLADGSVDMKITRESIFEVLGVDWTLFNVNVLRLMSSFH
jgi:hypothetical protein